MNIILIISDTFRYDNLFGPTEMKVRTPELDKFAKRSVSVSNFYTSSFPTIPHRTDLTTGRYGWPWYGWQSRFQSSKNHMPEILSQDGYVSQLLCDCPHLFRANFDAGFNGSHTLRGQEGDTYFLRMNYPIKDVMPPEKTRSGKHFQGQNLANISRWTNYRWYKEDDTFPPRTAGLVVEWLEENYKYHPFFLWVDFFDPHEPWDPPEYMVKHYDPDYKGIPMIHPNYGKASDYTPEELKNLRAHYCAEAELVDRWVGRILQKIDDLDLWDNSIVIFTTDHGMSLGEHNRTGKTNINDKDNRCWPIYPEVAHIPFMITAPGLEGGTTVDALLQPPDILPTLIDLGGVKVEPSEPFHGRSFALVLKGESQKPVNNYVISGSCLRVNKDDKPEKWTTPVVYTEKWAYVPIGADGGKELYDLENDPYAEKNIASDNSEKVAEMHGYLIEWLEKMKAPEEAVNVFE